MPPEQWSVLLHGDTQYESSIQSIIDELSTSTSFSEVIKEFSKVKDNHKIGRSTLQTRDHRTTTGVPPSDIGRK
jgi:hypothetical protein